VVEALVNASPQRASKRGSTSTGAHVEAPRGRVEVESDRAAVVETFA
jgi:hypothetical protein